MSLRVYIHSVHPSILCNCCYTRSPARASIQETRWSEKTSHCLSTQPPQVWCHSVFSVLIHTVTAKIKQAGLVLSRDVCVCFSRSVVSNSLWSHRLYPASLLCPQDFFKQEHWSGLPHPSAGDLPNPGIKPGSPALQVDSLPFEPQSTLNWRAWKRMMESRWVNLWRWKDKRETHLKMGRLCRDLSHLHSDHPVLHGQEINRHCLYLYHSFQM